MAGFAAKGENCVLETGKPSSVKEEMLLVSVYIFKYLFIPPIVQEVFWFLSKHLF